MKKPQLPKLTKKRALIAFAITSVVLAVGICGAVLFGINNGSLVVVPEAYTAQLQTISDLESQQTEHSEQLGFLNEELALIEQEIETNQAVADTDPAQVEQLSNEANDLQTQADGMKKDVKAAQDKYYGYYVLYNIASSGDQSRIDLYGRNYPEIYDPNLRGIRDQAYTNWQAVIASQNSLYEQAAAKRAEATTLQQSIDSATTKATELATQLANKQAEIATQQDTIDDVIKQIGEAKDSLEGLRHWTQVVQDAL